MSIRNGDSGPVVKELQGNLNKVGYKLAVDGDFGGKTEAAVKDFQQKHGLDPDGIAGPLTMAALAVAIVVPGTTVSPHPGSGLVLDDSEYSKLYTTMVIRDSWVSAANKAAAQVLAGKPKYVVVANQSGVPWHVIGCIHSLEGSCDFGTHLHNGDSLKARTTHVPAGRPVKGSPPFTWEDSALDALQYDHLTGPMSTLGVQFRAMERFNGLGSRNHGINTPYLWSGSNHYLRGKYVADGVWDASAVSKQVGAAVIIKILEGKGVL